MSRNRPVRFIVAGSTLCHNTNIGGRGDLAASRHADRHFCALLFFGGIFMCEIDRLISAGMSADEAYEIVFWMTHYGNDSDMERYILEFERGQRQRPMN